MEHLRGLSLVQALVLIQVVGTIQLLTAMALRVTFPAGCWLGVTLSLRTHLWFLATGPPHNKGFVSTQPAGESPQLKQFYIV